MSSKKVLTGPERKLQILETGAKLAAEHGKENVTRRMVAKACGCAESLISEYVGDSATAQNAYARKAKALGLTLPDKKTSAELGKKLRAHGPRDKRDTRKRSAKEVEAIKRKSAHTETWSAAGIKVKVPVKKSTGRALAPASGKAVPAKKSAAPKRSINVGSPTTKPATEGKVPVKKSAAKKAATPVTSSPGSAGKVAAKKSAQSTVARSAASVGAKAMRSPGETKPKHLPARPLPTPADAPRVVTPALPTPQPPERKTAARKPKAPPTALPATPSS